MGCSIYILLHFVILTHLFMEQRGFQSVELRDEIFFS